MIFIIKRIEFNKLFIQTVIILSFLLLSFMSVLLLIKSHMIYGGWDIQFHLKRIFEIKDSILNKNIFPNFAFNYFHGSSVMIMYPYFNLLPLSILSFFIKSKITLLYFSFIFNTMITFIISFYSNKSYTKSISNAYLFSIIYSLSNLFITYYFIVSDLGIVSTFTFLPLVFFGFLNIINNNGWMELSLGMSLLFYSHFLNSFIITIFLLVWLFINFKHINCEILIKFIKSAILFITLTSIIWIPFLLFIFNNFNNINMPFSLQLRRIKLQNFISGIYGGKNVQTIGFFPIITLFFSILFYKKFDNIHKQIYWISVFVIIFTLFFPFEIKLFKFLSLFQVTYRFFIIPYPLLIFIFSSIITKYILDNNLKIILYITSIIITILLQLFVGQHFYLNTNEKRPTINYYLKSKKNLLNLEDITLRNNGYKITSNLQFNKMLNIYHPSNNDYIPKSSLSLSSYVNHNLGFYNNNCQIKLKHIGYNMFNFSNKNDINKLSLPIYKYKKEKLYVYLNGKQVNNYSNKNDLLTINNIKDNIKPKNKIYIKPALDPFRIIGVILSIFGWLFTLGIVIRKKLLH